MCTFSQRTSWSSIRTDKQQINNRVQWSSLSVFHFIQTLLHPFGNGFCKEVFTVLIFLEIVSQNLFVNQTIVELLHFADEQSADDFEYDLEALELDQCAYLSKRNQKNKFGPLQLTLVCQEQIFDFLQQTLL